MHRAMRPFRIPLTIILFILLLFPLNVGEAGGSGWWVNTTDDIDDGLCDNAHCSLREAIIASNSTPGQQIIAFELPGTAPYTIEICSPLLPWMDSAPPPAQRPTSPPQPVVILPEEEPDDCVPTFTANMNLTCRLGPDSLYNELGYLLQGESALIEGRNTDSTWWYIPNPDWQDYCWVWDGGGDAICVSDEIAVRRAPPLPPTETPIVCSRDMGRSACEDAGGTFVESRTSANSYCDCP